MSTNIQTRSNELVPLTERMRFMHGFRLLAAFGAAMSVLVASEPLAVSASTLAIATVAYVLSSVGSHAVWRVSGHGGVVLFGSMLMIDGVYLAWASYVTGGATSPLRYMIIVHLIAVALLGSYRTGLKLAVWHSLLLLMVHYGQEGGVLEPQAGGLGTPLEQLFAFSAAFWIVTLTTATFSAVNERELRRRRYDLEALAQMATRVEEAASPEAVAGVLLTSVLETFDFQRGALIDTRDPEHPALLAARGDVRPVDRPNVTLATSALAMTVETRQTQLFTHVEADADRWLDAAMPQARNLLLVPLSTEKRTIAVFVIEHAMRRGSRIERRVVNTVERFASHGALALRSAWLLDQVKQMASTDVLTGIPNRMAFQDTLNREVDRAARERTDVSLVLFDVDHFKALNDSRGHQAGDVALREVATTLAEHARSFDVPARFGGEEFALVLPGAGPEEAMRVADRLRIAIGDCSAGVTVSGGVASFPLHAVNADALVGAADLALYESKRAGRNRVTAAGDDADEAIGPAAELAG